MNATSTPIGRFYGGIGALVCDPQGRYLLLRRANTKDYAPGAWECVTGRVNQGEGFEDALQREVHEELGVQVQVDFFIGTTHFFRGVPSPETELIGVVLACTLLDPSEITLSDEHDSYQWLPADEALIILDAQDPSTRWLHKVIERAEAIRQCTPPEQVAFFRQHGFELG